MTSHFSSLSFGSKSLPLLDPLGGGTTRSPFYSEDRLPSPYQLYWGVLRWVLFRLSISKVISPYSSSLSVYLPPYLLTSLVTTSLLTRTDLTTRSGSTYLPSTPNK